MPALLRPTKKMFMQPLGWGSILLPKIVMRKAAASPKTIAIAARENVPTAQPVTYRLLGVTRRLWDKSSVLHQRGRQKSL